MQMQAFDSLRSLGMTEVSVGWCYPTLDVPLPQDV
jgi:hypothetical protein